MLGLGLSLVDTSVRQGAAAPPVEGEADDSLLLFDEGGVTLLHLGLI